MSDLIVYQLSDKTVLKKFKPETIAVCSSVRYKKNAGMI